MSNNFAAERAALQRQVNNSDERIRKMEEMNKLEIENVKRDGQVMKLQFLSMPIVQIRSIILQAFAEIQREAFEDQKKVLHQKHLDEKKSLKESLDEQHRQFTDEKVICQWYFILWVFNIQLKKKTLFVFIANLILIVLVNNNIGITISMWIGIDCLREGNAEKGIRISDASCTRRERKACERTRDRYEQTYQGKGFQNNQIFTWLHNFTTSSVEIVTDGSSGWFGGLVNQTWGDRGPLVWRAAGSQKEGPGEIFGGVASCRQCAANERKVPERFVIIFAKIS